MSSSYPDPTHLESQLWRRASSLSKRPIFNSVVLPDQFCRQKCSAWTAARTYLFLPIVSRVAPSVQCTGGFPEEGGWSNRVGVQQFAGPGKQWRSSTSHPQQWFPIEWTVLQLAQTIPLVVKSNKQAIFERYSVLFSCHEKSS